MEKIYNKQLILQLTLIQFLCKARSFLSYDAQTSKVNDN